MLNFIVSVLIGINIFTKNIDIPEPKDNTTIVREYDNVNLIALICVAEAEGEPEEGKRWVIDSVLNRVDSDKFPNTVYDVVYQENQYACVSNGRFNNCYVDDSIYILVEEEIENRSNDKCVFFKTQSYHACGEPIKQIGNHYFSSLGE